MTDDYDPEADAKGSYDEAIAELRRRLLAKSILGAPGARTGSETGSGVSQEGG